jgi:hypothetical protein
MESQKNKRLKHCIKCGISLTKKNWPKCLWNRSNYICTPCFRAYSKQCHKSDPEYGKKQRNRHRMRRSAVIFHYGNQCAQCGEDDYTKLTIDHINGGGCAHRKEMTTNIIDYLYNNLVDKDGYQVLCYNCNCSKNVIYKDKYALRDKKIVIDHYGGFCAQCKEDRIERLTMDHKNNDGAEQRRKYGYKTGVRCYRWLIKKNFPNNLGLQVLCFNCNCSKRTTSKYELETKNKPGKCKGVKFSPALRC